MKEIQPVTMWYNGQSVQATLFALFISSGVLGESATFGYNILNNAQQRVNEGIIIMEGQAYADWGNNDDYAWEWAATKLNLTII